MKKYTQLAAAGSSDIEKPLLMITKPDNAVEVHSSQCHKGGKKTIVNASSFLQGALVLAALLFGSAIVFSLAGDQEGRKVVNIVVQDENINDMVDISAHSDFNYGASLNASMISMQNVKTVVASTRHGVFSDAYTPDSSACLAGSYCNTFFDEPKKGYCYECLIDNHCVVGEYCLIDKYNAVCTATNVDRIPSIDPWKRLDNRRKCVPWECLAYTDCPSPQWDVCEEGGFCVRRKGETDPLAVACTFKAHTGDTHWTSCTFEPRCPAGYTKDREENGACWSPTTRWVCKKYENYYGPPCRGNRPLLGSCGSGNRGNGCCDNGQFCSKWGWCGWHADYSSTMKTPSRSECKVMTGK